MKWSVAKVITPEKLRIAMLHPVRKALSILDTQTFNFTTVATKQRKRTSERGLFKPQKLSIPDHRCWWWRCHQRLCRRLILYIYGLLESPEIEEDVKKGLHSIRKENSSSEVWEFSELLNRFWSYSYSKRTSCGCSAYALPSWEANLSVCRTLWYGWQLIDNTTPLVKGAKIRLLA